MTLHVPSFGRLESVYYNDSYPVSTSAGVSITPGTSSAEGSWTASGLGALSEDIFGWLVTVAAMSYAGQNNTCLLDMGVDPAGGTSYTAVLSDLHCGNGNTNSGSDEPTYVFPLRVPSGATVGFRASLVGATAPTTAARLVVAAYGKPQDAESFPICTHAENFRADYTLGNATWGSWASLGTLTYPAKWIQFGIGCQQSTMTAETHYTEFAVGDGSNYKTLGRMTSLGNTSEAYNGLTGSENFMPWRCAVNLPIGAVLYVRGRCGDAPDGTCNANAAVFG